MLSEIARRCESSRVHLDLSKLGLDCFPLQLLETEADEQQQQQQTDNKGDRKSSREQRVSPLIIGCNTAHCLVVQPFRETLKSLNLEENPLGNLPSDIGV